MHGRRGPARRGRATTFAALVGVLVAGLLVGCGDPRRGNPSRDPVTTAAGPAPTDGPPATAAGPTTTGPAGTAAAWVTYDHDPARSGVDPTSPPARSVRPAWRSPPLDGAVYAQPLLVGSAVIVATENDTVYALDAATGAVRWARHLATPVDGATLPCGNIDPSGITGTPVADPATGLLWVVTFAPPAHHTLWSLRLADGVISGSTPADPVGAEPRAQQQRSALALVGSRVYVAYGGLYGDCSDYHGWVVGLSTTGHGPVVRYETPLARSAIWAPPGPAVGAGPTLYVATGNGLPEGRADQADSVVALSPALAVRGVFTPADYAALSAGDKDLGSTSPALLPGGLVFQIGKDGVGYLMRAADLGGVGGQVASAPICRGGFGGGAVAGSTLYVACFDGLYAVQVSASTGPTRPALRVRWSATGFHPGPPIVAGGVVWTVDVGGTTLLGLDAATGRRVFADRVDVAGSFPSPAAAAGRLVVPAGSRVAAYAGV